MSDYDPEAYWKSLLGQSFTLKSVGNCDLSLAFNRWQYRARRHAVQGAVHDVKGLRVLDVGAGTGYWVGFWHSLGAGSVCGVDLTSESVEKLRTSFPGDQFEVADIVQSVPLQGPFELISAIDVLLHITEDENYRRAARNLRSVARIGTKLVLLEPVTVGPPLTFLEGQSSRARALPLVRKILADSGWRVQACRPALWLMANPIETAPARLTSALRQQWRFISWLTLNEAVGGIVGAALFPLDRLLCSLPWGPTAKILVAEAF
jgi:SAM-dependent methyltransferase